MLQESILALRVLNMLNMYINPFSKNSTLNLCVYNSVNSVLGQNIVDSSRFAMVTFVGHSFLNSAHSFHVYNSTSLVDSHVCGQRNNSMCSKRPKEHMAKKKKKNIWQVPLFFLFVLVILANYWEMVVLGQKATMGYFTKYFKGKITEAFIRGEKCTYF